MREEAYVAWLTDRGLEGATQSTSMSTLRRVETAYGALESAYAADGLEGILSDFAYSKSDERGNEPNPSKIAISGNLYNSLASLRTHVNYYRRFLETQDAVSVVERVAQTVLTEPLAAVAEESDRTLSMEKDLQAALRASITQLEPGLTVIDGGAERVVASGRIDILARDAAGTLVVIELKAVKAPRDAVAQVLAYMGDLQDEAQGSVRGMLIAPDFDPKAVAAARVVPALKLVRYGFSFSFKDHT